MSQYNLTEGYNRLPSIIAEGQVNLHTYAKGQVNLLFGRKMLRDAKLFLYSINYCE